MDNKVTNIKNDGIYFMPAFTDNVVRRIKMNNPILISGPSGCGKTEFIELIARENNVKLYEIDFSVGVTESNLIGRMHVNNGETIFSYGNVPKAMKEGWLLLDEIDFAEPEHLACLQSILTGKPLIVTQNKSEIIYPHENFRIFATANTKGRGDESQSYTGTKILNISFIDRFSIFEMKYTNKEFTIINNIIDDTNLSKKIVDMFKMFRESIDDGHIINAVFSTRRLIQMAKALKEGEPINEVFDYEIIERFESSEKTFIKELICDHFDKEYYYNSKNPWTLGKEHIKENKSTEENIVEENIVEENVDEE